ncbi:hypothetical protein, partial [Endozoicomonas sp. SESOKO1]|uniref:hypothetical protein n=1 Tax=Endozoicomonas sp. SESOKO1 TaxID=2828742 RepID=UPI002148628B
MQALDNTNTNTNTLPFGSMIPEPAAHQQGSQFSGRATTTSHATRQVESNRSFDETPSLADRLIYPFYAAKNRLLKMAGIGAHAGYFSPILSAGVVCGTVGGVIGSTVGNLIKCLFFPNSDESAGSAGFYVGFYAGSLLAVPAGVALGVV